jgi:hypothetical protein
MPMIKKTFAAIAHARREFGSPASALFLLDRGAMSAPTVDCLIIGGGPAGLTAATRSPLYLAQRGPLIVRHWR